MDISPKHIAIGGLVQIGLITYSVLAVATFMKFRFDDDPPATFAVLFERYGIFLYVVPLVWTVFAAFISSRADLAEVGEPAVAISWGLIAFGLVILGVQLTIQASGYHSGLHP